MVQLKGNGTRGTGPKLASKDLGSAFRSLKKVQKNGGKRERGFPPWPNTLKKQANKQKVEKSWRKCSKKKCWLKRTNSLEDSVILKFHSALLPYVLDGFFVGKLHDDKLAAHKNLVTQGTHSCSSRWETTLVGCEGFPIPKITNGSTSPPEK